MALHMRGCGNFVGACVSGNFVGERQLCGRARERQLRANSTSRAAPSQPRERGEAAEWSAVLATGARERDAAQIELTQPGQAAQDVLKACAIHEGGAEIQASESRETAQRPHGVDTVVQAAPAVQREQRQPCELVELPQAGDAHGAGGAAAVERTEAR